MSKFISAVKDCIWDNTAKASYVISMGAVDCFVFIGAAIALSSEEIVDDSAASDASYTSTALVTGLATGVVAGIYTMATTYSFQLDDWESDDEDDSNSSNDDSDSDGTSLLQPHHYRLQSAKSYVAELLQCTVASSYRFCITTFTLSAIKAWILDFNNDDARAGLAHIDPIELAGIILLVALVDLPFLYSTDAGANARLLRRYFTRHPSNPESYGTSNDYLLGKILKPLSGPRGQWWIPNAGSLSHTFEHFVSMVVLLNPNWFRSLYKISPGLGIGSAGLVTFTIVSLTAGAWVQTRGYEGAESKKTLRSLRNSEGQALLDQIQAEENDSGAPYIKSESMRTFVRWLIRGQGLVHAADATTAFALPMLPLTADWDGPERWILIGTIGATLAVSAGYGTQKTEVDTVLDDFDKMQRRGDSEARQLQVRFFRPANSLPGHATLAAPSVHTLRR